MRSLTLIPMLVLLAFDHGSHVRIPPILPFNFRCKFYGKFSTMFISNIRVHFDITQLFFQTKFLIIKIEFVHASSTCSFVRKGPQRLVNGLWPKMITIHQQCSCIITEGSNSSSLSNLILMMGSKTTKGYILSLVLHISYVYIFSKMAIIGVIS